MISIVSRLRANRCTPSQCIVLALLAALTRTGMCGDVILPQPQPIASYASRSLEDGYVVQDEQSFDLELFTYLASLSEPVKLDRTNIDEKRPADTASPISYDWFKGDYQIPLQKESAEPASLPSSNPIDPEVAEALKADLILSIQSRQTTRNATISTVKTNNFISRMIFVIIHIPFGLGMYFAFIEFRQAQRTRDSASSRDQAQDSEIEIGLHKIAMRSSLHGLALLSFAFGFYMLYLTLVHPVRMLGSP